MSRIFFKPKIEVTVNDSGFDAPTGGSVKKTNEIWTGSLVYPDPGGKMFEYFSPSDVIKIYFGLDEVPDEPLFTGFVSSERGNLSKTFSLHGRQYAAQTDDVIIDQYSNLDGMEVSRAIEYLFDLLDISFTKFFTGTDPPTFVNSDLRFPDGSYIYPVIQKIRNSAFDSTEPGKSPLKYFLYESDEKLYFRKEVEAVAGNSWFTLIGGDNLIKSDPIRKTFGVINKQTVVGLNGAKATYTSQNRVAVDRTFAGKPVKDETLLTSAQCYEKARQLVDDNQFSIINTKVSALELIEAIPGLTIAKIENSKNVINGYHRIKDVDIRFLRGLTVTANIEKDVPLFGSEVLNSIVTAGTTPGSLIVGS